LRVDLRWDGCATLPDCHDSTPRAQAETRFVVNKEIKEYVLADIGSPPPFTVLAIEVPRDPVPHTTILRAAFLEEDVAQSRGLRPTQHTRGQPLNGRRFHYEVRDGRLI
jgi:hypothetical protein